MKHARNPPDVHAPVANYVHQIEVISERLLSLSGQIGMTADGDVPTDAIAQLEVALDNVVRNLAHAAMDVSDIVKMTVYFVGDVDATARQPVLSDKLDGHRPTMTVVFVKALATPQRLVEIDVWASR